MTGRICYRLGAVHAPAPGATLYLDSGQVVVGCAGDGAPARRLLRVVSAGAPVPAVSDAALAPADSDQYYTHILDQAPAVQRVLAFTEYPRSFTVAQSTWDGPAPRGQFDPDATDFYLNQIDASDNLALRARAQTIESQEKNRNRSKNATNESGELERIG
jgi:hypothetical protein